MTISDDDDITVIDDIKLYLDGLPDVAAGVFLVFSQPISASSVTVTSGAVVIVLTYLFLRI